MIESLTLRGVGPGTRPLLPRRWPLLAVGPSPALLVPQQQQGRRRSVSPGGPTPHARRSLEQRGLGRRQDHLPWPHRRLSKTPINLWRHQRQVPPPVHGHSLSPPLQSTTVQVAPASHSIEQSPLEQSIEHVLPA